MAQDEDKIEQNLYEGAQAFLDEFKEIETILEKADKYSASIRKNLSGNATGSSNLGLGTVAKNAWNSFTPTQRLMGGAAIGGTAIAGSFMSMAPNTMAAVTQRMAADAVSGFSTQGPGMGNSQAVMRSANSAVQGGATSAMGPTMATMAAFYSGGYTAGSASSKNIMASVGGLSAMTGQSNEQVAATLGGMNGMNFLRYGISIRDGQGNLKPMNTIVNDVFRVLFGGRTPTQDQAATILNPNSPLGAGLMAIVGGDQNLFQTIAMAVLTRAKKGSALTAGDMKNAQQALDIMGVPKDSPIRANFKNNSAQNKLLGATQQGLVSGYNGALDTNAAITNGLAGMATQLQGATNALMAFKGFLETFPNTGSVGGGLSGMAGGLMGIGGQFAQYSLMNRMYGLGGSAGAATGAVDSVTGLTEAEMSAALLGKSSGSSGMLGGLSGLARRFMRGGLYSVGGQIAGSLIGGNSAHGSTRSRLGRAAKYAGTGAAIGALIPGLDATGIPELIGGLLGSAYGAFTGGPNTSNSTSSSGTSGATFPGLQSPAPTGTPITQGYHGKTNKTAAHLGIDYGVKHGTPIRAAGPGTVTETGNGGGYGNYIIISHGGKSTLYAHLSKIMVKKGDVVDHTTVIALSGGTPGTPGAGKSTGPHLHHELRDNGGIGAGGRINPQNWFGKATSWLSGIFTKSVKTVENFLGFGNQSKSSKAQANFLSGTQSAITLSELSSADVNSLLGKELYRGQPLTYSNLTKYVPKAAAQAAQNLPAAMSQIPKGKGIAGGSPDGLMRILYNAGFRGAALETAFAVALTESNGNPRDHNYDPKTGDNSYGIFQINMLGNMGPDRRKSYHLSSNDALYNPVTNALIAKDISHNGKIWNKAWPHSYGSSRYFSFLKEAQTVGQETGLGTGGPDSTWGATSVHSTPALSSTRGGNATLNTSSNINMNVTMQVHIARASIQETEQMFQQFKSRIETSLVPKGISVY